MKLVPFLAILALASGGCRKGMTHGSFPNPAALAMTTGTFITTPGIYELTDHPDHHGQAVDFRLSISLNGRGLEVVSLYETNPSPRSAKVSKTGTEHWGIEKAAQDWFVFVEKPGTYWFFDGRDHAYLHGHGPDGSPSKSIIQGTFVNRDNPKVPDALLTRLPEKTRALLSPPADTRPSI